MSQRARKTSPELNWMSLSSAWAGNRKDAHAWQVRPAMESDQRKKGRGGVGWDPLRQPIISQLKMVYCPRPTLNFPVCVLEVDRLHEVLNASPSPLAWIEL